MTGQVCARVGWALVSTWCQQQGRQSPLVVDACCSQGARARAFQCSRRVGDARQTAAGGVDPHLADQAFVGYRKVLFVGQRYAQERRT